MGMAAMRGKQGARKSRYRDVGRTADFAMAVQH
jgi:hypothetical protein